jgi:hypothetical protein
MFRPYMTIFRCLNLLKLLHCINVQYKNYNSSQSMTVNDSLQSVCDYERLLFCCDWLGSDLRVGHFFSFRCRWLTLHSWTLSYWNAFWILLWIDLWLTRIHQWTLFITSGGHNIDHRTEQFAFWSVFRCSRCLLNGLPLLLVFQL